MRYIGNSAFQYCSGITGKLSIPNSVEYIGTYAFSACKNISDLDIGCDNISSHAFSYCDGLTKLELREGTGNFGDAFFMCQNLEYVHLPSTVTSLSETAFDHCVNLREINLEYIRSFGKWAFSTCGNLSITLNLENCEAIGEAAFSGCHNLAGHLVLPATLQSVAGKAFYGCGSLQAPTISYNNTPPTLAVNAFEGLYALEDDKDIYVPKESVLAYKSAEVWKDYNIQPIPDTELVLDRNTLELILWKGRKDRG